MAYQYPCILFRSHSNQSTKHPVDRLHHQIQEHSHPMLVASGVLAASCWLIFLATLLAVVLSIQVANAVLTTVVADQSVARTQSPEAVAKMAFASDVVVVQVSRQLLTPRGRSPSTDPRKVAQYLTRERQQQSAEETQQQSQLEILCRQRGRNHAAPLPLKMHDE